MAINPNMGSKKLYNESWEIFKTRSVTHSINMPKAQTKDVIARK